MSNCCNCAELQLESLGVMLAVLVLLWDECLPVSDVKLTGELGLTGRSAGSS